MEAEKIPCFFVGGGWENSMLFSRRGLRKFCFFCFSCFVFVVFCFVLFFFPPEIQGLVVLRNLFLKSYTFACGWEELSVIVRVTFSYAFFFSLPLFCIIEWTCSSLSLRKADVPGWKNRWEKVVIPTRHSCWIDALTTKKSILFMPVFGYVSTYICITADSTFSLFFVSVVAMVAGRRY